jgi:hypothetical protein
LSNVVAVTSNGPACNFGAMTLVPCPRDDHITVDGVIVSGH